MKSPVPATLILCACLALQAMGAGKKPSPTPPSTLPPTSPMIQSPAGTDSAPSGQLISSEMSGRDLEFFTDAVDAGREQAFYIGLLKAKASSDQIKSLADALEATQEEENSHIARLAALKGWHVSLEPTPAQKKSGDEIEKLSGSNFDKAAMDKIVAASKKAMDAYQGAAQDLCRADAPAGRGKASCRREDDRRGQQGRCTTLPQWSGRRHSFRGNTGAQGYARGQIHSRRHAR